LAAGNSPIHIEVADFNGDLIPDLAVANHYGYDLFIFIGHGDGTFTHTTTLLTGDFPQWIEANDFDENGTKDIAVAATWGYEIDVFLGNGDGSFQAPDVYELTWTPRCVESGDLNHDGHLDLAVSIYVGNSDVEEIDLFFGRGDGTFEPPVIIPGGFQPLQSKIADVNGDLKDDLIVGVFQDAIVQIYINNSCPDDSCNILGACIASGTVNANNPCQICAPAQSKTAWSANDGGFCNDSLDCTENDLCIGGICKGTPNDALCDDQVGCTEDVCYQTIGCRNYPLNANCDDGITCTENHCDVLDGCQYLPVDRLCDDHFFCNGEETCDETTGCLSGVPPCDPETEECIEERNECVTIDDDDDDDDDDNDDDDDHDDDDDNNDDSGDDDNNDDNGDDADGDDDSEEPDDDDLQDDDDDDADSTGCCG
jgi:hypothetical protein